MAYRFKDRICTVEIEDKKYPISFSQAMSERVTEAAVKLRELKGCKDEAAVVAAIDNAIDAALGDGCAAEIFEGRTDSAVERLDVLKYIQVETAAFINRFADVHTKQ